jgi:nicotinamide-nucleotide amidase
MLTLLTLLGTLQRALNAAEDAPPQATNPKPLDYVIVVTGGELLEGALADAHTHFLTRTLRPLGCRCVASLTVDDVAADIQLALRFATHRAPLVIVTGGLGPTPNDITRETLAGFTGIALQEQPDVLADMERRFGQPRDQLRPNLRRQALVPARGGYLKNPSGTAVGLVFETGGPMIVALPGPPRELQPMVTSQLVPLLQRRFGVRPLGATLTLRFVGAGQSLISQTLKDKIAVPADVTITSLFEASRVDFTFSLPHDAPDDRVRLQRLADAVRLHLGEYLYATDGASLEQVVLRKLTAQGGSLALAEVATGGHLAAVLSGVPEAADFLTGAFSAPSEAALARLLDLAPAQLSAWKSGAESAKGLASGAAKHAAAQWAIATGALQPGDGGGSSLWLAWRTPSGEGYAERLSVRDSSEPSRSQLTTQILDRLRRMTR